MFPGEEVNWVQCDGCEEWFHLLCVGLAEDEVSENEDYMCFRCKLTQTVPQAFVIKDDVIEDEMVDAYMAEEPDLATQMNQMSNMAVMGNGVPEPIVTHTEETAIVSEPTELAADTVMVIDTEVESTPPSVTDSAIVIDTEVVPTAPVDVIETTVQESVEQPAVEEPSIEEPVSEAIVMEAAEPAVVLEPETTMVQTVVGDTAATEMVTMETVVEEEPVLVSAAPLPEPTDAAS